jgi:DNA polymerase (family 10)
MEHAGTQLGRALSAAHDVMEFLRARAPAGRIAYAGGLRRQEASVGTIDLVCAGEDPGSVVARFVHYPAAKRAIAGGSETASLALADGLEVRLHLTAPERFGNLLLYRTGSHAHLLALTGHAALLGLELTAEGIAERATGRVITCETEEAVYAALGLPYIPPELRLGEGEVDAARDGSLPELVSLRDIRGDFHMHCTWSDGRNALEAMIEAAAARTYEYHSISDHSRSRDGWGLDSGKLRAQREKIRGLGDRFGIRTLCSSEVDILADGSLDFSDEQLAELDIVVASVHSELNIGREAMTARLIRACENPYVNIIGHPTGRHVGLFGGYDFDYDAVFAAAARTGTALELDGQPGRLDLCGELARRAKSFGAKFTCDSDAHGAADLANVRFAVGQARRGGLTRGDVVNTWPLDDVLAFVTAKRQRAIS